MADESDFTPEQIRQIVNLRSKREGKCLIWSNTLNDDGYAILNMYGKHYRVSRLVAYADLGLEPNSKIQALHHCDNRACVEKKCLFLGNESVNQYDAVSKGKHFNASKIHCSVGHEYTIENTRVEKNGSRACKICIKDREKRRYEKDKEYIKARRRRRWLLSKR